MQFPKHALKMSNPQKLTWGSSFSKSCNSKFCFTPTPHVSFTFFFLSGNCSNEPPTESYTPCDHTIHSMSHILCPHFCIICRWHLYYCSLYTHIPFLKSCIKPLLLVKVRIGKSANGSCQFRREKEIEKNTIKKMEIFKFQVFWLRMTYQIIWINAHYNSWK